MEEATYKHKIEAIEKWLGTGSINIFGRPYSGKDTHGTELAKMFGCPIIGSGEILRSHGSDSTIDLLAKGDLAPQDEFKAVVLPYLAQDKYKNTPLILSTVGRWIGEEQSVIKAAKESGHEIKAVFYLNVDEETSKQRWEQNERDRHDDQSLQVLENRMKQFEEKTLPVIEEYRKLGLVIEVNGNPPIDEVRQAMIDKLYKLSQQTQSSVS